MIAVTMPAIVVAMTAGAMAKGVVRETCPHSLKSNGPGAIGPGPRES
jgi:hypothetical protein